MAAGSRHCSILSSERSLLADYASRVAHKQQLSWVNVRRSNAALRHYHFEDNKIAPLISISLEQIWLTLTSRVHFDDIVVGLAWPLAREFYVSSVPRRNFDAAYSMRFVSTLFLPI